MKVKEIDRTANIAWSPAALHPIYMVAGTAAQQLDATFSTSAALELYNLNLGDSSLDMPLVSSIPSECRFHKVAWGCYESSSESPSGVIVCGADNGGLLSYNADKFIKGEAECLLFKNNKHTGAVKALDFNPFQTNLLASGGAESEIFIWDLNNHEKPMTPGAKSQPPEDVACVSWNRQVQHILASTFAARCVVWDLRKNEPIIKVSDSMSRIKCKLVCWNPEVATQMCLSSEDDHTPVIQLWDLRYATSPVKVLENHQRGILSMAWCPQDPELLLSCGKDNRILCWNPNSTVQGGEVSDSGPLGSLVGFKGVARLEASGSDKQPLPNHAILSKSSQDQVVYELPTSHQWSFDVQWCPRNPNVISSSSFDGHVTAYSLMGGGHPIQHINKVADSFSTSDPFNQAVSQPEPQMVMPLQKPPKWLQRPVGANFGFGGKLVSFENSKNQNTHQPSPRQISLSQVVTETDLLTGSLQLEQAVRNGQHVEFCAMKAANCSDREQENLWNFLMVNFEKEPRERYIQLLGYDKTDLAEKVSQHTKGDGLADSVNGVNADELAQKMNMLGTGDGQQLMPGYSSSGQASPNVGSKTPGSRDELNFSNGSNAFDDIGMNQLDTPTQQKSDTPLNIPADDDADGLLSQALLMGNFEAAVDMCLSEDKMAEAILLAIAGGPELLSRTQKRYFQKNNTSLGRLVSAVVTHDWSHIVNTCVLDNWKESLAVILTYSPAEEFSELCDTLASRLETERDGELSSFASLCYICSGNVERFVHNWLNTTDNTNSPSTLQDLVEKVMILRKAVEYSRGQAPEIRSGKLAEKLSGYASILAAQGSLETALKYLGDSSEINLAVLRDRLYQALGQAPQGIPVPQCPWQKVNILPQQPRQESTYQPAGQQPRTYQATAGSKFNTVTTGSTNTSNYPNQYSNQYANMNGAPGQVSTYNAVNPVMSQPSTVTSKGPLAHKYPSYPQAPTSAGYGTANNQPSAVQPYYNSNPQPQPDYSYNTPAYMTPATQPSGSPTGLYPNSTPGGPYAPQPTSIPSNQPMVPSFMDHKPKSAWNDPPMVKHSDKKPKSSSGPTPITNPIYGAVPQQPVEQGPPGAPSNYGNYYNPQEHQPEPPRFSAAPPPSHTHSEPKPGSKPAPEPVQEVVKGPLPAEHKVLQDIFDTLVQNCHSRANNAQMKRKLDDVTRKLEVLYDRLRDSSLSPAVTLGLHQIVQAIQQYDYNTGLGIYTQMVSQGNFSEISSFMPGLKMLIQSASQLQVYVQ